MDIEYELYNQEKQKKQDFLLRQLASQAYDLIAFAQFLNSKKGSIFFQ